MIDVADIVVESRYCSLILPPSGCSCWRTAATTAETLTTIDTDDVAHLRVDCDTPYLIARCVAFLHEKTRVLLSQSCALEQQRCQIERLDLVVLFGYSIDMSIN